MQSLKYDRLPTQAEETDEQIGETIQKDDDDAMEDAYHHIRSNTEPDEDSDSDARTEIGGQIDITV
jgi:hypothetical protein